MVGIVDRVTHPRNIADIIFLTFVNINIDVNLFVIIRHNTVTHYFSITIAQLVIFLNDAVEVIFVILVHKLLLAEQFKQIARLIGLFNHPFQLAIAQHLIAVNVDFMHLDFRMFVNINIHDHFVLMRQVFLQPHLHISLTEPFL